MDQALEMGTRGGSSLTAGVDSDPQLLDLVRQGATEAFDTLYNRHLAIAHYVARQQTDNPSDADDVVAESFASIFQSLKDGKGPKEFFRSYLLTVVRRTAYERNKKARRTPMATDDSILDSAVHDADTVLIEFESSTMAKAFKSLPERWQAVLWHLDIEGLKPAAAAPFVGLSPNGVSSLAIRAREGLRQAYLQHHISQTVDEACDEYASQLGKYARNALKRSSQEKVSSHLESCPQCTALLVELSDVEGRMRGLLFPLVAGIAFTPGAAAALASGSVGSVAGGTTAALPTSGAGKGSGALSKVVVAAAVAAVAVAGVAAWLLQPVSDSTVAGARSAPPVQPAVPDAPTLPAAPSTAAPAPAPPAVEAPPAVPPVATPREPAVVVPDLPVLQRKASVIDSAVVTSTPVASPPATPGTVFQTVEATFASVPGPNAVERDLTVDFSLSGAGTPTSGEAVFTLPDDATFISGRTTVPAGWDCVASGAREIRCTSSQLDPSSLHFVVGVSLPQSASLGTLDYRLGGQDIVTKTFTNTFH
ncbi:sigma-70 family RNA polymerase sigma factor [Paenarthrobacter sp. NPDC090522]|uniref:sigma-70 family RNA polymerase sigma factor n=1 Tax=Paenarthrobacter sp. NPDC090522 TaxID=3364383 RepID=UPI003804B718